MQTIKIIKNRSDIGAGTRGSDLGIDAIEIAAINKGNQYFNQHEFEDVETHNESIYDKVNNSFAKRIGHVLEQCTRLSISVRKALQANNFPVVLSGDHSSALGTISGIKAAYPDKKLGVIWIDAHADLHSPYTSPSGNIHGMPLAAALNSDNLDCQINKVNEETENFWRSLKNIGVEGAKLSPEHLVYFGVRSTEEPEDQQIKEMNLRNYMVDEIRYRGLSVCVQEALSQLEGCDHIYISFDVDSMDCDLVSYGTGTPVPKGFDPQEAIDMIKEIIASNKVVCLEFVEVNPLLDTKGNVMAETAFEILDEVTSSISKYL